MLGPAATHALFLHILDASGTRPRVASLHALVAAAGKSLVVRKNDIEIRMIFYKSGSDKK